jgi:hypothetical protein
MKYNQTGIKINSIEETENFKVNTLIEFECEQCHKKTIKRKRSLGNKLLCYTCKRENTAQQKYGKSFQEQCQIAREKTFLNKYGVKSIIQTELFKEKTKKTCLEKYGKENFAKTDLFQNKYKKTCLEKYGVDNYRKSKECKNKLQDIFLKKYGVKNPAQCFELRNIKRGIKKPLYKNIRFDSFWELAFWIYCEDNLIPIRKCEKSFLLSNNSFYFPDFIINNSEIIEIKSNYILKTRTSKEKLDCIKNNNIILISNNEIRKYLFFIKNKYGKDYLKSFIQNEDINED